MLRFLTNFDFVYKWENEFSSPQLHFQPSFIHLVSKYMMVVIFKPKVTFYKKLYFNNY